MGSFGHGMAGFSALAILALAVSGMLLLVAKMGGWRKLFSGSRGTGAQRLHTELARIGEVVLLLTSMSGAYMSAVNFELLPESAADTFSFAPTSVGTTVAPIASLDALAATPLSALRELSFPAVGDASDVFTLTTSVGLGYVDQGTGAMLAFTPNDAWQQAYEFIYLLHTGQGAPMVALLVGLGALAVPLLALTGTIIWWTRRSSTPRIVHNAPWRDAETIILVGSEAGSTWGFAATLHDALRQHGQRVHVAPMNDLRGSYPRATRLIVLAATYGDGAAPASARQFLGKLERFASTPSFSVLGFGDRSFPRFCGFAAQVDAALAASGLHRLVRFSSVDRQSARDFAEWGSLLGEQLGLPLSLNHVGQLPTTRKLVLADRTLYGVEVQAPVAVLKLAAPQTRLAWLGGGGLPHFEVGDLVGIIPPGSDIPRYYSLASSSRDDMLEICVRKQSGGLCSEFLHALSPGDAVDAFIRPNPAFRPARGRRPLILIGAGAGVAPLAGFVRHNRNRRPMHLFFGGRDPASDFLYRDDLNEALDDGRLASLNTRFSRVLGGGYVQGLLIDEADALRDLVRQGAQIMVCGGRDMAEGVRAALDLCLAPLGLSAAALNQRGLYLEDAY